MPSIWNLLTQALKRLSLRSLQGICDAFWDHQRKTQKMETHSAAMSSLSTTASGDVIDVIRRSVTKSASTIVTEEGERNDPNSFTDSGDVCAVRPYCFLVAWHGVLTLAFSGWPSLLAELKSQLNSSIPAFIGRSEAFGSRWPKMTLAAVCDNAKEALDTKTLAQIFEACDSFQDKLQRLKPISIRSLSIVTFSCRSLSQTLCRVDIPLPSTTEAGTSISPIKEKKGYKENRNQDRNLLMDAPEPLVQSVIEERSDPAYLEKVNAPGHRYSHYDDPWTETTLVAFISTDEDCKSEDDETLGTILDRFQEQVDRIAPQRYKWMPRHSLHMTLRSLDTR